MISFLLTRLLRGATKVALDYGLIEPISTHAPLARRDVNRAFIFINPINFYSRASCEARPPCGSCRARRRYFYSRASCEARLSNQGFRDRLNHFYSRASCEARLSAFVVPGSIAPDFYSRASCEARLFLLKERKKMVNFYSRASCAARRNEI